MKYKNALMLITILFLIFFFIAGCSDQSSNQGNAPEQKKTIFDKTSGFTLNECNELCDKTYDIQAQVYTCQSSCAMIGKEGESLDKVCLTIIEIYKRDH